MTFLLVTFLPLGFSLLFQFFLVFLVLVGFLCFLQIDLKLEQPTLYSSSPRPYRYSPYLQDRDHYFLIFLVICLKGCQIKIQFHPNFPIFIYLPSFVFLIHLLFNIHRKFLLLMIKRLRGRVCCNRLLTDFRWQFFHFCAGFQIYFLALLDLHLPTFLYFVFVLRYLAFTYLHLFLLLWFIIFASYTFQWILPHHQLKQLIQILKLRLLN